MSVQNFAKIIAAATCLYLWVMPAISKMNLVRLNFLNSGSRVPRGQLMSKEKIRDLGI